jgi:hypothetical protein
VRLPVSNDTLVFVAGVAALVGLLAYVGVAFANARVPVDVAKEVAPWTAFGSRLVPLPLEKGRGYAVRVIPATRGASFGAVVQTFVPNPTPGRTYVVGLWLKGSSPGRIGVELNEFRPGVSRYPVETTVPATRRWHHYMFSVRVHGTWLGLAVYIYRQTNGHKRTWFVLRGLT